MSGVTNDLKVYYRIGGTASNGVDYTFLNEVATLTNNNGYAEIKVLPSADNLAEGSETVTLTLVPTNTYLISAADSSATNFVFDAFTTVSFAVPADGAIEPNGPPGAPAVPAVFSIHRSDFRSFYTNLTVKYLVSGTASNGVDYSLLSGTVNFVPDMQDTNIDLNPLGDGVIEGLETVKLTLVPTNTYMVFPPSDAATNTIIDSSTIVSIAAIQGAVEPGQVTNIVGQAGFFTVSRDDSRGTNLTLTVRYLISGTASNGVDYTSLSGTVTLLPDALATNIIVQPLADSLNEGDETVRLTLVATNGYLVQTNMTADALIIEDTLAFDTVVTNLIGPVGIDYHAPSNSLIVSFNYNNGSPFNFARIYTNLMLSNSNSVITNTVVTNWSGVQGVANEVKLATVKTNASGFTNGETYFGSDTGIGWVSADGTRSNLNWCVLTNGTVTNALLLRGSLYADQTGVWSNNIIAVTSPENDVAGDKGVWRVNANGQPTLVAQINTLHLEGVITLPNDVAKWGPWAGKIITGDESLISPPIYAIATNGTVTPFDTTTFIPGGIRAEDFEIIPTNQDLYCVDHRSSAIVRLSKNNFTNNVGDLLVTEEGVGSPPAKLFIIHWNASTTNFETRKIVYTRKDGTDGQFEHVSFAPIDFPNK